MQRKRAKRRVRAKGDTSAFPMPIDYPPNIADSICQRIAEGESLRKICSDDGMPSKGAFLGWVLSDAKLADQYSRARDIQTDGFMDEIPDIADDIIAEKGKRKSKDSMERIQRARLRIETRKWQAGKQKPKKWGDVDRKEISGPAGGPLNAVMRIEFVDPQPKLNDNPPAPA